MGVPCQRRGLRIERDDPYQWGSNPSQPEIQYTRGKGESPHFDSTHLETRIYTDERVLIGN